VLSNGLHRKRIAGASIRPQRADEGWWCGAWMPCNVFEPISVHKATPTEQGRVATYQSRLVTDQSGKNAGKRQAPALLRSPPPLLVPSFSYYCRCTFERFFFFSILFLSSLTTAPFIVTLFVSRVALIAISCAGCPRGRRAATATPIRRSVERQPS